MCPAKRRRSHRRICFMHFVVLASIANLFTAGASSDRRVGFLRKCGRQLLPFPVILLSTKAFLFFISAWWNLDIFIPCTLHLIVYWVFLFFDINMLKHSDFFHFAQLFFLSEVKTIQTNNVSGSLYSVYDTRNFSQPLEKTTKVWVFQSFFCFFSENFQVPYVWLTNWFFWNIFLRRLVFYELLRKHTQPTPPGGKHTKQCDVFTKH